MKLHHNLQKALYLRSWYDRVLFYSFLEDLFFAWNHLLFPNKKFLYRLGIGIEHHFLVHLHQRIAYKETILKWQSLKYRRILLFLVGYIFVYAF